MFSCPTFKKIEFIDLLVNAPYYGHLLNISGAIGFKKLNINEAQQQELARRLGDFVNWFPNTKFSDLIENPYYETLAIELQNKKSRNEMIVEWSMDITRQSKIAGVLLNNVLFQCDKRAGSTLLIDMRKVYNLLKPEWKKFVDQIEWVDQETKIFRKMVELHRNTNQKILIFSTEFCSFLYENPRYKFFINGKELRSKQKTILSEILVEILDIIHICNLNILEEWKWNEKDLLIVDGSCMLQATKGGFKYGSRVIHKQVCVTTIP